MTVAHPDLTTATGQEPAWLPIAGLLAGAGALHLAVPKPWEPLIPKALGDPAPWVFWSGVAELAIAGGLVVPRTRRVAGLAAAALFVGVFPGNITMAAKVLRSERAHPAWKAGNLARLPLQLPLITRSLRIARARRP